VWVVGCGCLGLAERHDVSQKFPKFVFGSFFQSFGDSPSGEFLGGALGAWGWMVPVSFHQNGVGLRLCVTTHPTTPRGYTMLFRVTNSGKKYDITLRLRCH
jgi:hypothetical protein